LETLIGPSRKTARDRLQRLRKDSVVDLNLCYVYNFQDPSGNRFELNCFETGAVRRDLIEPDGISPIRYW
jgi:hypothetical protein